MGSKTHDEAKREEGPALDDAAGHVSAVVALADDALVALDLVAEGVLAADEEEEHDCWTGARRCSLWREGREGLVWTRGIVTGRRGGDWVYAALVEGGSDVLVEELSVADGRGVRPAKSVNSDGGRGSGGAVGTIWRAAVVRDGVTRQKPGRASALAVVDVGGRHTGRPHAGVAWRRPVVEGVVAGGDGAKTGSGARAVLCPWRRRCRRAQVSLAQGCASPPAFFRCSPCAGLHGTRTAQPPKERVAHPGTASRSGHLAQRNRGVTPWGPPR